MKKKRTNSLEGINRVLRVLTVANVIPTAIAVAVTITKTCKTIV